MEEFQKPLPKLKRKIQELSTSLKDSFDNNILEEEVYLDRMQKIIRRDFFPELKKLEELQNNDFSLDNDETDNMTLSQFMKKYKSEDNEAFRKLMEREDQKYCERLWWMFLADKDERKNHQMLALENDSHSLDQQKMITNGEKGKIQYCITQQEVKNPLYFTPDQYPDGKTKLQTTSQQEKKIYFENTRFEEASKPLNYGIQTEELKRQDLNFGMNLSTPQLLGLKDQSQDESQMHINLEKLKESDVDDSKSVVVNGYKMLQVKPLSPNRFPTLMTWGEVEGTPQRLDKKKEFSIAPCQKDEILNKLTQKFYDKKKVQRQIKQKKIQQIISSVTPSRINGFNSNRYENNKTLKDIIKIKSNTQNSQISTPQSVFTPMSQITFTHTFSKNKK